MNTKRKLTGIILSGGKSTRMNTEKGLCIFKGKPMIEHIIDVLKPICSEILISANNEQYDYLGYKTIADRYSGIGPISGIYSGLEASQTDNNMILSCDMPLVSVDMIRYIYDNRDDFDIVIPERNNYYEPLCAYYHRRILSNIEIAIQNKSYKLIKLIKSLNYKPLKIDSRHSFFHPMLFENINSPNDLKRAENYLLK